MPPVAVRHAGSFVGSGLAALVAIAGCATEPPARSCAGFDYVPRTRDSRLTDLPRLKPLVTYRDDPTGRTGATTPELALRVRYGEGGLPSPGLVDAAVALRDGDEAYCPNLSFAATLDGVEQPVDWQTGWRCFGPNGATCVVPSVTFSAPDRAPDAQLVVADRSASLALPLGDLLVERTLALTGAADWTFHPGQQVVLQWSAPADLQLLGHVLVSFLVPCASCPGGEKVADLSSAPVDGATIRFVAPSTAGSGKLSVEVQSLTIDYGAFYLSAFRTASHAATIAP